jgi:hypothetical protein
MATTTNTTTAAPPSITVTPKAPVAVTVPAATTTYTNFRIVDLNWSVIQSQVRVTVLKTTSANKIERDVFLLSPTEMQVLATSVASAGETFMTVANSVLSQIVMIHYNFTA